MPHTLQPFLILGVQVLTRRGEDRIAGIMSDDSLVMVNSALESAKDEAFRLGVSQDIDPFMTLSFMALPVIPTLRITTRGVFDVNTQRYI